MPRKTIDLDDEAADIYDAWDWKNKSRNVSEAIKEYHKKGNMSVEEKIKKAIAEHEEKYHN